MKPDILIVDDDGAFLRSLILKIKTSRLKGIFEIRQASSGEEALSLMEKFPCRIVLTDMKMPGISGTEVAEKALGREHPGYVITMTGFAEVKEAVELLHKGVYDYIAKPFDYEELFLLLERVLRELDMENTIDHLRAEIQSLRMSGRKLLYSSSGMEEVHRIIQSVQDNDFPVLILGESGTGKEVIADTIHYSSFRKNGPYIKINSAGLVANLLESEMFGHEKGAFTGAHKTKAGKFELAEKGTLFLDEIGDMDIALQAKLLRTLQDGSFQRVGGNETIYSDVRIIAATNRSLKDLIKEEKFREDLYYRLNIITINVPPLRERLDDIPLLSLFFIEEFSKRYKKQIQGISENALEVLKKYSFPGNVRELENIMAKAYAFCRGPVIDQEDLPKEIREPLDSGNERPEKDNRKRGKTVEDKSDYENDLDLPAKIGEVEKEYIHRALKVSGNNRLQAARLLGVSRRQLYYLLEKHDIL